MRNYQIHLIRHGRTAGNRQGRFIGATDLPLSGAGREQLRALAEQCHYPSAELVYTAAHTRAVQTAEILYPGLERVAVPELCEMSFGVFEGKSPEELKQNEAFLQWAQGGMTGAPPGGEDGKQFAARIAAGFTAVMEDLFRRRAFSCAVICSGSALLSVIMQFTRGHGDDMFRWMVDSGCGYTLLLNPQLWMNDRVLEAAERIPYQLSDDVDFKKIYFGE